jgi:hypothetical protein
MVSGLKGTMPWQRRHHRRFSLLDKRLSRQKIDAIPRSDKQARGSDIMPAHMPPVPPANRAKKGSSSDSDKARDTTIKHPEPDNTTEQGDRANVMQNTTNKGGFRGRRMK